MKLIMENFRKFICESTIDAGIVSMIDKLQQAGGKVQIEKYEVTIWIDNEPVAEIDFEPVDQMFGPCLKASSISQSWARDGYGPLVYDIAIEHTGGLVSDRTEVSTRAERVWDYYATLRDDVQVDQLDITKDNVKDYGTRQLTPRKKSDDCEQFLAYQSRGPEWNTSGLSKKVSKKGTPVIDELGKRKMII